MNRPATTVPKSGSTATWGWLEFNDRVLAEALDDRTPLLERAKFLAIFTSNLDEFFMKRIAILRENPTRERLDLLAKLRARIMPFAHAPVGLLPPHIVPGLARHGITLADRRDLTDAQREEASAYFDEHVSPALTLLVIDHSHPFPFLSNLSTSLVFSFRDPDGGESKYARIKVPNVLRQWVQLSSHEGKTLVPLYGILRRISISSIEAWKSAP